MTCIAETLRNIEERAERAIVQELRLMTHEILVFRTQLVSQERNHADALLLKLDQLMRNQTIAPASSTEIEAPLLPTLIFGGAQPCQPVLYKTFFYNPECGDLEDIVTLDTFEAAVQLVIDRLAGVTNYVAEAAWTHGKGSMKVLTLGGTVLASVEGACDTQVAVHPAVVKACHALQFGDTSRIEHLFGQALMAA